MFGKSKTEKERQQVFDENMLSILKEREVIKKNKKIIEEKGFSYDPTINEDKMKGASNSYVDKGEPVCFSPAAPAAPARPAGFAGPVLL